MERKKKKKKRRNVERRREIDTECECIRELITYEEIEGERERGEEI